MIEIHAPLVFDLSYNSSCHAAGMIGMRKECGGEMRHTLSLMDVRKTDKQVGPWSHNMGLASGDVGGQASSCHLLSVVVVGVVALCREGKAMRLLMRQVLSTTTTIKSLTVQHVCIC